MTMMEKIIVNKKYDGKKLNKVIMSENLNINYNTINKLLRKKDIKINGKRTNKDIIVYENDIIEIYIPYNPQEVKLDIVYEDENINVVNKPLNIEVTGEQSLTEFINKKYNNSFKIQPCHRIDRNTTGLVLFAKNPEALEILLSKFKNKEIKKNYRCTVIGTLNKKEALLKAYLFKDNKKSLVYILDTPKKGYMEILTKYKVLSEDKKSNTSVLDVELITGRTHQIRAHLAHIGHPILGDGKYGVNEINKKFKCKYQMLENYKMKFDFTTDSGALEYLNQKEIILK